MCHKVCHISTVHMPWDTRVFHKECKSLAHAGYDVHLVIQGKDEEVDGVIIHGLRHPNNRIDRMSVLVNDALEEALALDAELYHLHDPELLRIAAKLKRAGKCVVFDSHELYRYQIAEKGYLPKPIAQITAEVYTLYETSICQRIDAVITPCTRLGENPFEGRAKRIEYVDNFPILRDNLSQTSFMRPRRDAICYVGSLTYDRGITHMIRAAYKAGVTAILAGPIDDVYHSKLRAMPEYECVDYRGFVDRLGVELIIREAFCGVAALLNVGQYWLSDNLPTKAYEYMAGGIPFIMSPTPYAEMLSKEKPCYLMANPENIDAYAEAIKRLQNNVEEAEQLARVGYEALKERFNWQYEIEKLVGLYKELLS